MEQPFSEALTAAKDMAERTLQELFAAPSLDGVTLSNLWQHVDDPRLERFLETALALTRLLQRGCPRQRARQSPAPTVASAFTSDPGAFSQAYGITELDRQIVIALLEGCALKHFPSRLGMSSSAANKRIRQLWQRLGLSNREQLLFVFGWMRLVSPAYLEVCKMTTDS